MTDINAFIKEIEKTGFLSLEYEKRVEDDVKHTLKKCGGDGNTYSDEQKQLMVWYNYFFLNRGKPSTHIEALSTLSNEQLVSTMPNVFTKVISAAEEILQRTERKPSSVMQISLLNGQIKYPRN